MCIDYRAANKATHKDHYPLPHIDDLIERLHGVRIFSKLGLADSYHQLRIQKADCCKTAFITPEGLSLGIQGHLFRHSKRPLVQHMHKVLANTMRL